MRCVSLGCFTAALLSYSASAEVSSDLAFCSKLAQQSERLACYDAVARIDSTKSPPPAAAEIRRTIANASAVQPYAKENGATPVTTRAPFHGAYVAAGGSYGIRERFTTSIMSIEPEGFSGIAAAGYNIQTGSLVAGIELRGRYGDEGDTQTATTIISGGDGVIQTSSRKSNASIHGIGRLGAAIDQTMIFGYAGFGASHHRVTTLSVGFGPFLAGSVLFGDTNQWLPSAVAGAGIEQNFGRVFARATAEIEAMRSSTVSEFIYTTRATGSAGVRF